MELRKYQTAGVDAILAEWDAGRKSTLLVLPTGTGKTIVFSKVASEMVKRGERVLILAHRQELLDQAADKIARSTGLECAVEKAEDTAQGSWYRITVGSVQTLMREGRQSRFSKDHYGVIIIDEAHHALSDSYRRILAYFNEAKVLGVTATPDRGDMRDLGEIFESLAFEYTLPKAIKEGHLCKIKALTIPLKIDLAGVGTQAGDFKSADLDGVIGPYLTAIAKEMAIHCKGRKTVVFLPLVATSQKFRDMLADEGFRATEVNGESDDRKQVLEDFHAGKYDVLCNSMLLTEGWDEPAVDCIVCLRPTKVRSLYAQIVGRGTRLSPGKDNLLLLDFLWHTSRHELCRPASLICQNQELADEVTQILAEERNAAGMDLEEAVVEGENSATEKRESALAKELERLKARKKELVDPVRLESLFKDETLSSYEPKLIAEMQHPTSQQLKELEFFNVYAPEVKTAGKAAKLLETLKARKAAGLASTKQVRFLSDKRFVGVESWKFEDAKKLIDRIAVNQWRLPPNINPSTYKPGESIA